MKIPFKQYTGDKMVSIYTRGAAINYQPMVIEGYEFFEECWRLATEINPKLVDLVVEEYNFLVEWHGGDERRAFHKKHPFWKKEKYVLFCEYNDLFYHFNNCITMWDNSRDTKNLVSANNQTCISYLQVMDDTLFVVSRSLDISCGFKTDPLTIKLLADSAKCKNIIWQIIAPHNYVENIFPVVETYEELLTKKTVLKVRKEVS